MQGPRQPLSDAGLEAAADVLDKAGRHHHWWSAADTRSWRELDPIGQSEFLGIVQELIYAYLAKSN
jgi:3-dehydro-4-phosphotetronate decarboxylase